MEETAQGHEGFVEREKTRPLLQKNDSWGQFGDDNSLESNGQLCLQKKPSDWRAPAIVLGFECLESTALAGIGSNLVIYLSSILHESSAASATDAAAWTGTTYFTPIVGAIIADTYLGSYWNLLFSALIYVLGMITVTLSAYFSSLKLDSCGGISCPSATTSQSLVFFSGLYLVAFGSGGVKSSLLPLGADQFNDDCRIDRERKRCFFSLFYICLSFGSVISSTLLVWLQENVSWAYGYGIATACLALALGGFLLGTPIFQFRRPTGSPLKSLVQVLVASFRKTRLEAPIDSSLLYELSDKELTIPDYQILAHTDAFRFLDKAATISDSDVKYNYSLNSWGLCTVTQVEELKILFRLLPIWITCIVYTTAYSQVGTTFIQQGNAMNTKIGGFSIPPASLSAFQVLCIMLWSFTYEKITIPITNRYTGNSQGLSQLQRIGIGRFLMIVTMAMVGFLEWKRLQSVKLGKSMSIMWQLPQYFVIAGSEAFNYVGQLEFFYDQAPNSMKSMCTSFYLLSLSLGNYSSSIILTFVSSVTCSSGGSGWLPDNLDDGHLDYFFLGLTALSTLNFVVYLVCARNYTLKKVPLES